MADLTGAYTTPVPTISQNTAAVIKYRANYIADTAAVSIPISVGLRNIITSIFTEGKAINVGFGEVAGTITDLRFAYSQAAGPLDLSNFFGNAPFSQYKNTTFLVITGEGGKAITVAYVEFKG